MQFSLRLIAFVTFTSGFHLVSLSPLKSELKTDQEAKENGGLDNKVIIHQATLDAEQQGVMVIFSLVEASSVGHKENVSSSLEVSNALQFEFLKDKVGRSLAKIQAYIPCPMDFFYYPFDKQTCTIKIDNGVHFGGNGSSPIAVQIDKDTFTDFGPYHLRYYRIATFTDSLKDSATDTVRNEGGELAKNEFQLQLVFARETDRNFPIFYFPVISLMVITFFGLFIKSKHLSMVVSVGCYIVMLLWVIICQPTLKHLGVTTVLDHYQFLCLNLSFQAAVVSIMLHLYMQNKHKKGSLDGSVSNGSSTPLKQEGSKDAEDDDESHILQMGAFRRFIYFKMAKPTKKQLPVVFLIVNIIYWTWMIIARLRTPKGFHVLD